MVSQDQWFYNLLRAIISMPSENMSSTDSARQALAGGNFKIDDYIADMIDERWLDGAVERDVSGRVSAVFVHSVTERGRLALSEHIAHSVGQHGLEILKVMGTTPNSNISDLNRVDLARLYDLGLITLSDSVSLSRLGEFLIRAREARPGSGATIIQGVNNSQIALGSSWISGSLSVLGNQSEIAEVQAAVEELTSKVKVLQLSYEIEAEVLADLATIRSQLNSPKPKRNLIHACAENIQVVLQGVVGNAAFAGIVELIQRLKL